MLLSGGAVYYTIIENAREEFKVTMENQELKIHKILFLGIQLTSEKTVTDMVSENVMKVLLGK